MGERGFYFTRKRCCLSPVWIFIPAELCLIALPIREFRDTDKVFEAVIEARKRTEEGDRRALQLLRDSQADIKKIVGAALLCTQTLLTALIRLPSGVSISKLSAVRVILTLSLRYVDLTMALLDLLKVRDILPSDLAHVDAMLRRYSILRKDFRT